MFEHSSSIVIILQFKTSYSLAEITSAVRSGMAEAIATAMGNSALADSVILYFSEVDIRRSQRGVLVDVGLRDYQGSTAALISNLTESNINAHMLSMGLRPVQSVVVNLGSPASSNSTETDNKTSSVPENNASKNTVSTIIAISVSIVGAFAAIAGCICWRLRHSSEGPKINVSSVGSHYWFDALKMFDYFTNSL